MVQFHDFTTGEDFNPITEIKKFFVNPYMQDMQKMLGLADKYFSTEYIVPDIKLDQGILCLMLPISILRLGRCAIHWNDINSGVIKKANGKVTSSIYFKVVDDGIIRIDSVINR